MDLIELNIKGAFQIIPTVLSDERGLFFRSYCKIEFLKKNIDIDFVQFNHSFTKKIGAIRGLHYQLNPSRESKLIRCVGGKVADVVVDLREGSPTFLNHQIIELSEEQKNSVFVPFGCAHGFQTLSANCSLVYHHTDFYSPELERGIKYNDPLLKINWPLPISNISARDNSFALLPSNFIGISML